ncbi:MAG: coproporphyrinogen III oxidase [Firmicutes bacterium HGW-Firmicutes-15]|nr:MAG: coproporphyrinogen III oxidase [Firmicutes bacterium HGW-Firmicutes-15]
MTNSSANMGIYIHIPFCLHKCDYCDFYSLPITDPVILEKYTRSVISELRRRASSISGPLASIYLGGGTPSLLLPQQVERIVNSVFENYQTSSELEISMEANPATVNLEDLKGLKCAGVNRLSVGVQSFADIELKTLGRMHGGHEAESTLRDVVKAGFNNFNIDLIYGLPGQTLSSWQENLSLAMNFNPQHISTYLLQLDESTRMARKVKAGTINLLDDELESSLYYTTLDFLAEEGYYHYEISNFARTGYECRHNLLYWQAQEYLGIGCGAVSYINRKRFLNQKNVNHYIEDMLADRPLQIEILETMTPRQLAADAIILGLRLTGGIKREEFRDRFGIDIMEEYRDVIKDCQTKGFLEVENDRIYLSKRAYFISNQVFMQFMD